MTLRQYLQIGRDRWQWILGGLLVGMVLAGTYVATTAPVYAATTSIYITALGSTGSLDQAYSGSLLAEEKIQSYPALITGERVRADVEEAAGVPVAHGQISAVVEPGSVLMAVTVTDSTAVRARDIAFELGTVFTDLVSELERFPGSPSAVVTASVLSTPELPQLPISPNPPAAYGLGVGLGLFAGLGAALMRNSLDQSLRSHAALREVVRVPHLGGIPYQRGRRKQRADRQQAPSAITDSYGRLRIQLELSQAGLGHGRILVTSAVAGEGRTTIAINLAIATGATGKRVLLLDADLRRPQVAQNLGLDDDLGLSTVLAGGTTFAAAVHPFDDKIDVMTAGYPPEQDPGLLLSSSRMADLLEFVADEYDVVLVDSPSVLAFGDATAVAAHCDGALLVVDLHRTSKDEVAETLAALAFSSIPVVGTVSSARRWRRWRRPPFTKQRNATATQRPTTPTVTNIATPEFAPDPASSASNGAEPRESVR